jgi:lipopolysaccharide transport protein LptA
MSMAAFQTPARSNAVHRTAIGWLLSLCCLLLPAAALPAVAPSDSTEDILYSADGGGSIETIGNVRTTTLRGNVRIQQGLITIFGDTATLEQDVSSGDLIRVTVEGEPARFVRNAEDSAETINGSSARIVYYNQADTQGVSQALLSVVEFQGQASFTRGRTALECSQIKHIVETGATDSPGPCSGVLAPIE